MPRELPPIEGIRHVHLIAVAGTGMGSLACMLADRGFHVTGSDLDTYPPMSDQLRDAGIAVKKGFVPDHVLRESPDDGRVQVLGDDGQRVVGDKGKLPGRQLVQHHAQGVDVGAAIELLAQRKFWSQVEHGAGDNAFAGQARGHGAGEAKIVQLGRATCPRQGVRSEQDVFGLEVAVDDAVGVGVPEGGA